MPEKMGTEIPMNDRKPTVGIARFSRRRFNDPKLQGAGSYITLPVPGELGAGNGRRTDWPSAVGRIATSENVQDFEVPAAPPVVQTPNYRFTAS